MAVRTYFGPIRSNISEEGPVDFYFFGPMAWFYPNKFKTGLGLPGIVFLIFDLGYIPPQGAVFSLFWGCLEADMNFSLFLGRLEADTTNLHMDKFSRLIWIRSYPKVMGQLKNDHFMVENLIFRVLLSHTVCCLKNFRCFKFIWHWHM